MSGYLPLDSTYTTSTIMSPNATTTAINMALASPFQKITPQDDYKVSVHPTPFQYYSLQHGLEPNNAYFNIMSAYNGICSTPAFRQCTGNTIDPNPPSS